MEKLTKLLSKDFYRSIWRIMSQTYCDEYWRGLWYKLAESVEGDPEAYPLYLPLVHMYAQKFFEKDDVKKKAESLGLTDRISKYPLEYNDKATLEEFADLVIELGDIIYEMEIDDNPEYEDYAGVIFSEKWDSYLDSNWRPVVDEPTILDVNWMEGHTDSYISRPYQALVEYEGHEYEICLAKEWPETIYVKTDCPYMTGISEELINYRFHRLYDGMDYYYQYKFFRVSKEEREEAMKADLPLIVGGKINHIDVRDGNTHEKLVKIVIFVVNNCLRRIDLLMRSNMEEIHEYEDHDMINYGWPPEPGLEQFKKNLLDTIHQYRDELDDGFIVERPHMSEENGCPREYFYDMDLGMF